MFKLKKHILVIYAILSGMIILLIGFSAKVFIPVEINRTGQVIVKIERGQSLISIAKELENEKIIDSPLLFRILISLRSNQNNIPAGFYLFSDGKDPLNKPRVSLNEVARRLANGENGFKPLKITFPEGLSVMDIAKKVHTEIPEIDAAEFASNAKQFEGYIFPDTYLVMPFATSGEVIAQMKNNFDKKVTSSTTLMESAKNSGHTLSEIIIMASILEGEVRTFEDRRLVSDLLWRRIENGMPLQVDSTFAYINQKTSAELTLDDLKIDSLYNTYKYKGLPPTPISNPGLDTIIAAIEPVPNDYVFFLNDKDGISHFSKTYKEHLKLKNQYLR